MSSRYPRKNKTFTRTPKTRYPQHHKQTRTHNSLATLPRLSNRTIGLTGRTGGVSVSKGDSPAVPLQQRTNDTEGCMPRKRAIAKATTSIRCAETFQCDESMK